MTWTRTRFLQYKIPNAENVVKQEQRGVEIDVMPIEITEIRWVLTAKVLVFQFQVVVMLKRPAPWVLALHQNFSIHNELYRPYLRRIRLGVGGYADIRWIYMAWVLLCLTFYIPWNYPPPSNSDHQEYYILNRESLL